MPVTGPLAFGSAGACFIPAHNSWLGRCPMRSNPTLWGDILIDQLNGRGERDSYGRHILAQATVTMGSDKFIASLLPDGIVHLPFWLHSNAAFHEIAWRLRAMTMQHFSTRWDRVTAREAASLRYEHAASLLPQGAGQ